MKKNLAILALIVAISITVMAKTTENRTPAPVEKKFVYAVFYFHDQWDAFGRPESYWVNSSYVSDALKAKVKSCTSTDAALIALGAEGWELVSVINERTSSGTEYDHYLKKAIN